MSNRRDFVKFGAVGALAGATAAATWKIARPHSGRQLGVIGVDESQIWLLETPRARVLVALGPENGWLLENLPALVTVERQRLDVLVADHAFLTSRGRELIDTYSIDNVISAQPNLADTPLGFRAAPVADYYYLDLAGDAALHVHVSPAQPDSDDLANWYVGIELRDYWVMLTATRRAIRNQPEDAWLTGLPVSDGELASARILVTNHDDGPSHAQTTVLAQPTDPTWFGLRESTIELPQGHMNIYES